MCDISDLTDILNVATREEYAGRCNKRSPIIYGRLKQFRWNIDTVGAFNEVAFDAQALFHKPLICKSWEVHVSHHYFVALRVVDSRDDTTEGGRDVWCNGNFMHLCSDNVRKLLPRLGYLAHPY